MNYRIIILTIFFVSFSWLLSKAQTYGTLPFNDDFTSGSINSSWSFSDAQGVGTYSVSNLSGGWPNFGTCSGSTCTTVGATSGNGLIVYNSSSPSGSNQLNMDLHLNLAGKGSVDFQYAVVDWRSGWDSLAIHLSNDGGATFTRATVVKLWLAPHSDGIWNEVTHDLSSLAAATGVSFTSNYVVRLATYLEYTGSNVNPKNWPNQSVYYDNFNVIETTPLPVELTSFEAKEEDGKRIFNWITSMELDNDYFALQKSFDGKTWANLNVTHGAGKSEEEIHYSYVEELVENTGAYYRLKQVDFNGSTSFSDVLFIKGTSKENLFRVLNNGAVPKVQLLTREMVNVEIFTLSGSKVFMAEIKNSNDLNDQLQQLSSGNYIVSFTAENTSEVKKITINK